MRKIYLLIAALFVGVAANAQSDDFESYPIGPYFGGHWTNWSKIDIPTENIMIDNYVSVSGDKSGAIGDNGEQDAILIIPMKTSGKVTVNFKLFIEFGSTAYFNFQKDLNQLGVDGNWANQWYWGVEPYADPQVTIGMAYYTANGQAFSFDYPDEQWIDVAMEIDLDNNLNRIFIDGEELSFVNGSGEPVPTPYTDAGSAMKMNGMDFYSHNEYSSNSYFIDDISVVEGGMGVNDLSASSISVYPTVTKDMVHVTAKSEISHISVFNTAGQEVMKVRGNGMDAQINVSSLPAGVYMVKIQAGKEVLTKKVVVK